MARRLDAVAVAVIVVAAGFVLVILALSLGKAAGPRAMPPDFGVVSYDTPTCGADACLIGAVVQNRGGSGSGILTFTVTDKATGSVLTRCSAQIPVTAANQETKALCLLGRVAAGRSATSMDIRTTIYDNPPP